MIRLQVIGSAGGFPHKYSQTSGYILYVGSKIYIFDAPENTLQILMQLEINFNQIEAIFISHMHYDHIGGLMNLIYYMSTFYNHKFISLYGPTQIQKYIQFHVDMEGREKITNIEIKCYPFSDASPLQETDTSGSADLLNEGNKTQQTNLKKRPILTTEPIQWLEFETFTPETLVPHKDDVSCDANIKQLINNGDLIIKVFELHHRIASYGFYININMQKLNKQSDNPYQNFRLLIATDTNLSLDYSTLEKYFVGKINCILTECTFMDHDEHLTQRYGHNCPKYIKKALQILQCDKLIVNHYGRKAFSQNEPPEPSEILPNRIVRFQKETVDFGIDNTYKGRPYGYVVLY